MSLLLSSGICFAVNEGLNENLKAFQEGYGSQKVFQEYTREATSCVKDVISETISGKSKINKNELLERVMYRLMSLRHATDKVQMSSCSLGCEFLADPSYLCEQMKRGSIDNTFGIPRVLKPDGAETNQYEYLLTPIAKKYEYLIEKWDDVIIELSKKLPNEMNENEVYDLGHGVFATKTWDSEGSFFHENLALLISVKPYEELKHPLYSVSFPPELYNLKAMKEDPVAFKEKLRKVNKTVANNLAIFVHANTDDFGLIFQICNQEFVKILSLPMDQVTVNPDLLFQPLSSLMWHMDNICVL